MDGKCNNIFIVFKIGYRADPPSYDPGDGENCRSVKDGRGEMFCKGGKHHDERERGG